MRSRIAVIGLLGCAIAATALSLSSDAFAQSAADKATARQLATEAIQLFRQERYRDALDKMERAETLFGAPVHLLYIARCQGKLGKLVESAESYRRLVRLELPAQAPQTFRDAIADGQKELSELEPTIPALRIEVRPADAKNLRITIDDEAVSNAIVGINRPTNPGPHTIRVEAAEHAPIVQQVKLEAGKKQAVTIDLGHGIAPSVPAAGSAGSNAPAPEPGTIANASKPQTSSERSEAFSATKPAEPRPVKLVIGLHGEFAVNAGSLDKTEGAGTSDDRKLSQRFGAGGGGELHAGVSFPVSRFRLTPLVFLGASAYRPGPLFSKSVGASLGMVERAGTTSVLETAPSSTQMGLGVRFDTAPTQAWSFGGFGELDLVARQVFSTSATWSEGSNVCKFDEKFSGSGLRLAVGALVPVTRFFSLEGRVAWTVGVFDKFSRSPACTEGGLAEVPQHDIPSGLRSTHSTFTFGLGGQFGLGL